MRLKFLVVTSICACAIAAMTSAARAETVDDIVTLAQKNVGEDVILAAVDKANNDFNLSAADIIKLKNANISNTVITTMLKHHPVAVAAQAPAPVAPAPVPALVAPAAPPAVARHAPIPGDGQLEIENLDNRAWSYRYEPAVQTIWIIQPTADRRGNIAPSGGLTLRMASGIYQVRYSGGDAGATVAVNGSQKSQLLLSRVNTDQLEALYVSVFENGEKQPGGRLVVLRENAAPPAGTVPLERAETAPPAYYPPQAAPPTTTYVYREPVYVAPPVYYAPYPYYRPYYYYPRSYVGFNYFGGGRHGRSGIGLGFGF